ncbi:uncharacterized protein LOC122306228 [Carya illinoinensis]|uniref:uncharacterized protein LOC122306228 n=1 Tax=Carya illinoinensis TaxID=32201 RepID=UPI001C7241B9|nr:uncharacterized protein LOC122306228 [Carya illinoinensis]
MPKGEVETHLFIKGFNPTYTQWIFHGEEETRPLIDVDSDFDLSDEDEYIDDIDHMLDDIWAGTFHNVPQGSQGDTIPMPSCPSVPESTSCKPSFDQLLEDARRPLFTGCTKFSKLSFVVKLLHIKTLGGWSIKSFDMLLKLLRAAFPDVAWPSSYEEARSLERGLGFKYHKIHACPNDCILFWKENADKNECPVCKASRWMSNTHGTRVIPQKVLRHFPLVPRLQRLYMSTKISTDMRWHKDQRATTDTIMRHPADFESWKTFDKDHSNDIDVYLQPLVDELVELWENGVRTYDASTKETFTLHAALMWTINDFPTYGNLSGWSTKGKMACPSCNANTESNWLKFGRKQCYMGHRRFLPPYHIWRSRKGLFNGKEDHCIPPRVLSGSDIVSQLHMLGDVQFGKSRRKRKRTSEELNWTKISIFFKLPYWSTLSIRHNLDVIHTEKNICDNIFGTFMNIPGKTKDNINARRDLEILGMQKELHLRRAGEWFTLPPAMYTLHGQERNKFCEWLADVKFPDGFASNIARCVSVRDCKISGFKSHDCHVFLQRLLPIAVGGFLRSDIALALIELSSFFKKLCSRTVDITHLSQLQSDVVIILSIHLPREAILGGPVQYRWMYPFERYLGKFKRYVKNKARPEGSIAEAYIHYECLTFCSMYLQDVETKFNRVDRNIDGRGEDTIDGFSIFNQHVRPLGIPSNVKLDDKLLISARWFNSKQREPWRRTQNSGVVVTGENLPNNLDFYGVINEILELRYMGGRHVYLFSCDWFDVGDQRRGVRVDVHMTSVNMSRTWYKDEPFVLACQTSQCYYVKYLRLKGNWYVVQKFTNRNVYDIPPRPSPSDDIDVESSDDDAYQEEVPSYEYAPMHCDDDPVSTPLSRTDIEPISIDAAEVMHLGRHDENTIDNINDEVVANGFEDSYGDGEYSDEEYFSTDEDSMSN